MAASSGSSNSLGWESFLPNHAIFKALGGEVRIPSEQPYLGRNILVEKDGDIFLWDDSKKRILVANLRNLKAKNERSSKLQTLLCTNPPSFNVSKMVFSETGTYLALVGKHGVCVMEMPQKRGKFTQFEHGKDTINCRTVHLDDHFFTCHQTISIFEAKWFPGSSTDVHLVVLTSDNHIRLYDITEPKNPDTIITLGAIPPDQSLCSPSHTTFAEAFGEVVVDFDFAPAIEVKLGALHTNDGSIAFPVFLLQENGDVLYMLLLLTSTGFYYELRGYLSIFPAAEDNYGIDSCAILCFPTNPVVVSIATCSGTIYHSIALDMEDDGDVFDKSLEGDVNISKDERHIRCLSPKLSLCVYECIELSLTPETNFDQPTKNGTSGDIQDKKEEYFAVKLFHDPSSVTRYHCYHSSGVFIVTLPWLKDLQQFCSETEKITSFDPNTHGSVQHLICTNPVPTSLVNLIGFTVIGDWDLGTTMIALTNEMECITKPLRLLNRSPSPTQISSSLKSSTDNQSLNTQPYHAGEFQTRIKQILRRYSSTPLVRSGLESSTQLSPKECFQFLSGATETFRLEYCNKFQLAKEEIDQRVDLLAEQSIKQMDDLAAIEDDRESLQDHLRLLAEKYEDTKDRQEILLKRIHRVLEFIQSRQPILSDAEIKMRDELNDMSQIIQRFKKSFDQLKHKQRYLKNKQDTMSQPKERSLSETQKKQLKMLLKKEGDVIEDLVSQVNHLKLQVGF